MAYNFWSQVYPSDVGDSGMAGSDLVSQAAGAGSPLTATGAVASNGPTISLLVLLGLFVAIRLLIDRGVSPGE